MVNHANYWILRGVNSFGQYQSQEIPEAEAFFLEYFEGQIQRDRIEHREIQYTLFGWYRNEETEAQLNAGFCLRCFVSNCIYQFCLSTEQKYRETYGLSRNDLFPVLLDIIPQNYVARSRVGDSLISDIINTFDLSKDSSLSTWTSIKVKGNREYKIVLKFYGIVEVTDWLILVKTTPGKLERKLRQQGYSESEIQEYGNLLEAFHQVYRTKLLAIRREINTQRKAEGKGKSHKPYPPPTNDQLKQISKILNISRQLEPQEVLNKLKNIAHILRNNTIPEPINELSENTENPTPNLDRELEIVIYNQIEDILFTVTNQVIEAKINYFMNKKTPKIQKANNLILGLNLFYCQGYSMGEIANQLELSGQSQVSRLLKLKELREDVSRNTISILKDSLKAQVTKLLTEPEKLAILDNKIQEFIEPEIQEVIQEAEAEVFDSKNKTRKSLLARTVCQCLKQRGK
ncbi:MAG: hypothetical protein QNJ65_08150 [Xenococcaceae cyanobacterium MO_234.B1]|nr:hypothetical protein [Xenococcaceae cyanobacterium MO_234.B1]